jgi:hypothetical protein
LIAKGDALMQGNRGAEAVAAYRHAAQLRPSDEAVKSKLSAAEALQASATPPPPPPPTEATAQAAVADTATRPKAPKRTRPAAAPAVEPPVATVASLEPQPARTYSNDAPPGRTN